ncbi:hypothetical protein Q7P37_002913 [Cladosporium fusiforme]
MVSGTQSNLEFLRSRTQVDWDSLDLTGVMDNGMCVDATSNQLEVFDVMSKPENIQLLLRSRELATDVHSQFSECTFQELAFDVAAVLLATRIAPFVSGKIHIMANPRKSFSAEQVIAQGKRFHWLCGVIDPDFDRFNRLVMKIACTWEGMQAARSLQDLGITTLATTIFSMPQAILAGEAGCLSISPFCYELKELMDETYTGSASIAPLCVQAQEYFQAHGIPTKVKACGTKTYEEIIALAGVDAFTVMPDDLAKLAKNPFDAQNAAVNAFTTSNVSTNPTEPIAYISDEAKYRVDFARFESGLAQYKLMQAMAIFSDYQHRGECLMKLKGT